MKDFEYAAAGTVDEAVSLLSAAGDKAKVLAGGTDVIVQLREHLRSADLVVDVKRIPELMRLDYSPETGLSLGAATPAYRIYEHPETAAGYAGICDAARIIGGWQIQSRASLGGNLCNASPAADSIPAMIAYHGVCRIAGPQGSRSIPVENFCTAPGRNALQQGELLTAVDFPPPAPRSGGRYERFIPRNEMDIAVVGVGVWVRLDESGENLLEGRVALGAVAPTPLLASAASNFLSGRSAVEETFAEAARLAQSIARPIDDMRGTAEYRVHLVGVLTRRVLAEAVRRARQSM